MARNSKHLQFTSHWNCSEVQQKNQKCLSLFNGISCMTLSLQAVDADVTKDIGKCRTVYYYSTLDIYIHEIEVRFDSEAINAVRYLSTMCIWNDRQSDENDIIRQLACTMYHMVCDPCSTHH